MNNTRTGTISALSVKLPTFAEQTCELAFNGLMEEGDGGEAKEQLQRGHGAVMFTWWQNQMQRHKLSSPKI